MTNEVLDSKKNLKDNGPDKKREENPPLQSAEGDLKNQ
jgi:hypothetical protein